MATLYTCCRCDGSGTVYVQDTYDAMAGSWSSDPVIIYYDTNGNYLCAKILSEGTGSSSNELNDYGYGYDCSDCCDYYSGESGCSDCSAGAEENDNYSSTLKT